MKDLVIKSGDFTFENKRYRCKPLEHVKGKIEMYNVPICNTGNVTLSAQGCFNMSIEKLTCSNITWRKEELFTFTGGVLNAKNILIKNILANTNVKYNKPKRKIYFLLTKVPWKYRIYLLNSIGMSSIELKRFSAVMIVRNSAVKIFNVKMVNNSFRNFVQANKSSLYSKNMTLIENKITSTLCRVKESNVTLHEIKFHRNSIGYLISINLKSKVVTTSNSVTGSKIFKNAYSIWGSLMKLSNTNFHGNKLKRLIVAKSQSHIYIEIMLHLPVIMGSW